VSTPEIYARPIEIGEIYEIAAQLNLRLKLLFSFDLSLRDPASPGYQSVWYFMHFLGNNIPRKVWKYNFETNKFLL